MHRHLLPALAALAVLPASAQAAPGIAVSSAPIGSTGSLPASASHRLTLTGGAEGKSIRVSIADATKLEVGGEAEIVAPPVAVSPFFACPGRWTDAHMPRDNGSRASVTVRVPPGRTAWIDTTVTLSGAPWTGDDLDAVWTLSPEGDTPFDVVSSGPAYTGPLGVELHLQAARAAGGRTVLAGFTEPAVNSGRVELFAYPPRGNGRAMRLGRSAVRNGRWSFAGWRPRRAGSWEVYARYRTAGRTYADDAMVCGAAVIVR